MAEFKTKYGIPKIGFTPEAPPRPETLETITADSARLDYPRDARMALVEIESISNGVSGGASGVLIHFGWGRYEVLETDIPLLEALVQSDNEKRDFEVAQRVFLRDRDEKFDAHLNPMIEAGYGPDAPEYREELHKIGQKFGGSDVGTYRQLNKADVKPLRSFKVLERGRVSPLDIARVEKEQNAATPVAAAVAAAVKDALGSAHESDNAALAAAIAAAVKEALAGAKKV